MRPLRPRQAWGFGVLVACGGLLAIAAVAADGAPLRAPLDGGGSASGRLIALVELLGLLGLLAGVVLIVMALVGERNRAPQFRSRRRLLRNLVMVAVALALLILAPRFRNRGSEQQQQGGPRAPAVQDETGSSGSHPTWPIILLGAAVVVALGAAARASRRSVGDEASEPPVDTRRQAVRRALDLSLEDLEAEPDPRAAIIAAYARLLDGLEQCGLGREKGEAPVEHLERALRALAVREAPMRSLVDLFVEARFSEHVLTAAHKADAIGAFRAARDDLGSLVVAV
jgi:hypothetical protein